MKSITAKVLVVITAILVLLLPNIFTANANPYQYQWIGHSSQYAIPRQAMAGGTENGQPLYVCRVRYKNGLHPGKVVGNKCYIGYGCRELVFSDYELLIGRGGYWDAPSNLSKAFAAGTENGGPLYLCRAPFKGGLHLGKVVDGKCNFGYCGREIVSQSYEVFYMY